MSFYTFIFHSFPPFAHPPRAPGTHLIMMVPQPRRDQSLLCAEANFSVSLLGFFARLPPETVLGDSLPIKNPHILHYQQSKLHYQIFVGTLLSNFGWSSTATAEFSQSLSLRCLLCATKCKIQAHGLLCIYNLTSQHQCGKFFDVSNSTCAYFYPGHTCTAKAWKTGRVRLLS